MAYNLFIAYDLDHPGQNYDSVRSRIKALGAWHQFQLSLFYVSTDLSPAEAFAFVRTAMDGNDRLAIIDATGGIVTAWDRPAHSGDGDHPFRRMATTYSRPWRPGWRGVLEGTVEYVC